MVIDNFQAHDKQYEIRISSSGNSIEIRAFCEGQAANGYSYNVTLETVHDLEVVTGQDAIKDLARIAKDDVLHLRYEKFLEALKTI